MQGKKLKKYHQYLKRLQYFSDAVGVKVYFKELKYSEGGEWIPDLKRINIDDDLCESIVIASFLHELGHSMDDLCYRIGKKENALLDAYIAHEQGTQTKEQMDIIIKCEVRAWHCAKKIAKRLNIPLGAWFYDFKRSCLRCYRQELKKAV